MGTSYEVLDKGSETLTVDEMSNVFGLRYDCTNVNVSLFTDMPTEDLVKLAVKLLKVASYYMQPEDIQGVIAHERVLDGFNVGVSV